MGNLWGVVKESSYPPELLGADPGKVKFPVQHPKPEKKEDLDNKSLVIIKDEPITSFSVQVQSPPSAFWFEVHPDSSVPHRLPVSQEYTQRIALVLVKLMKDQKTLFKDRAVLFECGSTPVFRSTFDASRNPAIAQEMFARPQGAQLTFRAFESQEDAMEDAQKHPSGYAYWASWTPRALFKTEGARSTDVLGLLTIMPDLVSFVVTPESVLGE
jgi:hypothetical protein